MPYPQEYQIATIKFQDFLSDVKLNCDLGSSHMAYTLVQGVFQAFRRRLGLKNAIRFSNLLPAGLRALFVADWNPDEPVLDFSSSREELIEEFQSLRKIHNFTYLVDRPSKHVYDALMNYVDQTKFEEFMNSLPNSSKSFWDI